MMADILYDNVDKISKIKTKICLIEGTYQQLKFPVALNAMFSKAKLNKGKYLIRVNSMRQADIVAKYSEDNFSRGLMDLLIKGRELIVYESNFYLDSQKVSSQKYTPRNLDGIIFYCAELLNKVKLESLLNILNGDGFVYLPTWTDNKDTTWIKDFDFTNIVVHHPDKDVHRRLIACLGHKKEKDYI